MIILVIDDDELIAETVQRYLLKRWDPAPTVLHAPDCDTGLLVLDGHTVDCVLLDQKLLETTGTQCLKRLRDKKFLGAAIIVTGYADSSVIVEALRFGADDFLLKDELEDNVIMTIERALAKRAEMIHLERKIKARLHDLDLLKESLENTATVIKKYTNG